MKLGQFVCLENLQRLKNRFGNGYNVQVKILLKNLNRFNYELISILPGIEIDGKHEYLIFISYRIILCNTIFIQFWTRSI
jgi:hypothetical protein